jgi:hypothetical protein
VTKEVAGRISKEDESGNESDLSLHGSFATLAATFGGIGLCASGLNLAVAAALIWNTVYLERAVNELRSNGKAVPDESYGSYDLARLETDRAQV